MTPWYFIPIGWLPVIIYYFNESQLSWQLNLACIAFGFLYWTFAEYSLHRFLFHAEDYWLPKHRFFMAHHFLIHGIHHAFPMDRYRLVFPVVPGYAVMGTFIIAPLRNFLPEEYSGVTVAGALIMYILYDMIHYAMHHSSPQDSYFKDLKKYHM